MRRVAASLALVFVLVGAACTGGDDGGNVVVVTMWMGYTPPPPEEDCSSQSLQALVDAFNAVARRRRNNVTMQYVNSDFALQKATVGLQGASTRHLLPVRHEHAAARAVPEARRPTIA